MTYVPDPWESYPGQVVCHQHGLVMAMDTEGVARHKGSGTLCSVTPALAPERRLSALVGIEGAPGCNPIRHAPDCPEGCGT